MNWHCSERSNARRACSKSRWKSWTRRWPTHDTPLIGTTTRSASFVCLLSKEFLTDNAHCATNYACSKINNLQKGYIISIFSKKYDIKLACVPLIYCLMMLLIINYSFIKVPVDTENIYTYLWTTKLEMCSKKLLIWDEYYGSMVILADMILSAYM